MRTTSVFGYIKKILYAIMYVVNIRRSAGATK